MSFVRQEFEEPSPRQPTERLLQAKDFDVSKSFSRESRTKQQVIEGKNTSNTEEARVWKRHKNRDDLA